MTYQPVAASRRGVRAVDLDGAPLIQPLVFPSWYRASPERAAAIHGALRRTYRITGILMVGAVPWYGLKGVAFSACASLLALAVVVKWMTRGLERVPPHRVRILDKARPTSWMMRNRFVYGASLTVLTGLVGAGVWLTLNGEPVVGVAGTLMLAWGIVELIRGRRVLTERLQSKAPGRHGVPD